MAAVSVNISSLKEGAMRLKSDDQRPCPECGGELTIHNDAGSNWTDKWAVRCGKCEYKAENLTITEALGYVSSLGDVSANGENSGKSEKEVSDED
jgi:DNA-directed RNA polymerase subunit M/transcription elongation factor TFIIS